MRNFPLLCAMIVSASLAVPLRGQTTDETSAATEATLCDSIVIISPEPLELTKAEVELLCGSKELAAWSAIPANQQKFFLSAFLQRFGFHEPSFEKAGGKTIVRTGDPSFIREVRVSPNPENVDLTRHWQTFGARMTPENLDLFINWLIGEYHHLGYPCLAADALAYPDTGVIDVNLQDAEQRNFPVIDSEFVAGINETVLRRYDAFSFSQTYDSRLLDLSSQRLMRDEVVVSSNFLTQCPKGEVQTVAVRQRVLAGEPRIVTYGVGADTEEYLITEAAWKHARYGENATQIEASVRASFRLQRAGLHTAWYYSRLVPRHFLSTLLVFSRKNEESYESVQIEPEAMYSLQKDVLSSWHLLQVGLRGSRINVRRGEGPRDTVLFGPALVYATKTHDYEYYEADPREGSYLRVEAEHFNQGIGSDIG